VLGDRGKVRLELKDEQSAGQLRPLDDESGEAMQIGFNYQYLLDFLSGPSQGKGNYKGC
jgi:hypothetical protein